MKHEGLYFRVLPLYNFVSFVVKIFNCTTTPTLHLPVARNICAF